MSRDERLLFMVNSLMEVMRLMRVNLVGIEDILRVMRTDIEEKK